MKFKLSLFNIIATLVLITAIRSFTLTTHLVHSQANSVSTFWDQNLPKPLASHRLHNKTTMVFVHVGKTGGETIKWRLHVTCNLRGSKRKKAKCHEQFQSRGDESYLSHSTIGYTHCGSQRPRYSMTNCTAFLLSIRDPIDRIVSWYQYMHPENCFAERPSGACNLKKDTKSLWGHEFYDICFPNINAFIQSMKTPLTRSATKCSKMAIDAVQGNGPKKQSNHLYYNYNYNFNRTARAFPEKDIVVVRQEYLWDDMRHIEDLLGGDPTRKFEYEGRIITHGSEKFRYKADLDPDLISILCCTIPDEIFVYTSILHQALNLEYQQKKNSIAVLLSKCKAKSLKDLSLQCGWNSQVIS